MGTGGATFLVPHGTVPRVLLAALLVFVPTACDESRTPMVSPASSASASTPTAPRSLGPEEFRRALEALAPHAGSGESVLEVRARPGEVRMQVRADEGDEILELIYDGAVRGPFSTLARGEGSLEDNLFSFGSVEWARLPEQFPAACDAVDPDDGMVEEVVVRRHLPFSRNIVARIYVESPRLSGYVDANRRGHLLQR